MDRGLCTLALCRVADRVSKTMGRVTATAMAALTLIGAGSALAQSVPAAPPAIPPAVLPVVSPAVLPALPPPPPAPPGPPAIPGLPDDIAIPSAPLPQTLRAPAPPSSSRAVLQGLDKVTARISSFEVPINQLARFGTLEILVRACHKTPPEEPPESTAFLEISDARGGRDPSYVFRGWMFASSPALSALEHPVYDVWVVDCKNTPNAPSLSSR